MDFSETVLAAMIGAVATVSTALFQLFTALRSKNKLEMRPKKGMTLRSILAVIALMLASGVGGYLYSGLRQQSANEDLKTLREELNAKLQQLALTTERLAQVRESAPSSAAMNASNAVTHRIEAVVFAPACPGGEACGESNAQRLMVCGAKPNEMQVRQIDLYAKKANSELPWEQAATSFEQDVGGGKFTGAPVEHPHDASHRAVCVEFMHWGMEPHVARMVLQLETGKPIAPTGEAAAVAATSVSTATQGLTQGVNLAPLGQ